MAAIGSEARQFDPSAKGIHAIRGDRNRTPPCALDAGATRIGHDVVRDYRLVRRSFYLSKLANGYADNSQRAAADRRSRDFRRLRAGGFTSRTHRLEKFGRRYSESAEPDQDHAAAPNALPTVTVSTLWVLPTRCCRTHGNWGERDRAVQRAVGGGKYRVRIGVHPHRLVAYPCGPPALERPSLVEPTGR